MIMSIMSIMPFLSRNSPSLFKLTKSTGFRPVKPLSTIPTKNPNAKTLPYLKPLNSKLSNCMRNGQVQEAENLFDEMPQRSVVTWNAMIRGYFQNGQPQKAVSMFNSMPLRDMFTYNTVVSGLVQCGDVEGARVVFDRMVERDVVTWNSMIAGCVRDGLVDEGVRLFERMPEGMRSLVSWNLVIGGLVKGGRLDMAMAYFVRMGVGDAVTWNSMIVGFFREGLVDEGVRFFERMPMELRDVVSWNLVIDGLLEYGKLDLAVDYFGRMEVRDDVSWRTMISGLARAGCMDMAYEVFDKMPVRDIRAWNVLMAGYLGNGCIDIAESVFKRMPERNVDSWKQLIDGLLRHQRVQDAIKLFMEMPQKCETVLNSILLYLTEEGLVRQAHVFIEKLPYSDVVSWTNIIVGYFESGDVRSGNKLFNLMPTRDTTMWNVMIHGLGENGLGEEGLKYFVRMRELGLSPDAPTFTSVFTICADIPSLNFGEQVQAEAIKTGFTYFIEVSNATITMYARCGFMQLALAEFSSMHYHNVISWNSIICGFSHHGFGERALEMFERMRLTDVDPSHITFVGVLSACSHAGLVEQGKYYFDYMINECHIMPTDEHYTCLIDMLGRSGLINEAMEFLNKIETNGIKVPASVWGALLGACRIHGNMEVGEIAGERALELEPSKSGIYMNMAGMYSSVGRREDAERILAQMEDAGVKKQLGCSWMEMNNNGHLFSFRKFVTQ